jgi:hypothetical protein
MKRRRSSKQDEVGNLGFSCSYNISFNVGIKGHLFDIIDYYNFYYRTALRISSKTCSNLPYANRKKKHRDYYHNIYYWIQKAHASSNFVKKTLLE